MPLRWSNNGQTIVRNNGTPWRVSHQGVLSRRHPHPRQENEVMISRANAQRLLAIRARMRRLNNRAQRLGMNNMNYNSNANNNYNVHNQNLARREIAIERLHAIAEWNALNHNFMVRYGNHVRLGHPAGRRAEINAHRQQQNLLRRAAPHIVRRFVPGRRRTAQFGAAMSRLGFDPLVRNVMTRQYIRSARGRLA